MTCLVLSSCLAAGQRGAEDVIASTKEELLDCYGTVKDLEAKGGNVTGLIETLNGAAQLLTNAELAYLAKNYSSAISFAEQSRNRLSGFEAKASLVRNDALNTINLNFYTDALLAVSAFMIFCVAIAVWLVLGRKSGRISGQ
jgi:hypothetical protein